MRPAATLTMHLRYSPSMWKSPAPHISLLILAPCMTSLGARVWELPSSHGTSLRAMQFQQYGSILAAYVGLGIVPASSGLWVTDMSCIFFKNFRLPSSHIIVVASG